MKKLLPFLALSVCMLFSGNATAQIGTEMTGDYLTNANMDDGLNGWTYLNFKTNTKGSNYDDFSGTFIEQWCATTAGTLSDAYADGAYCEQTISVPNGVYLFSAWCISTWQLNNDSVEVNGVLLYANGDQTNVFTKNGIPEQRFVMTSVTDETLTVGFKIDATNANWVAWDNAQLYFYEGIESFDDTFKELAVDYIKLQSLVVKANSTYASEAGMLASARTELGDALSGAAAVDSNPSAASTALEILIAAYDAAVASQAEYALLNDAIVAAQAIYSEYEGSEFVAEQLLTLSSTLDDANAKYLAGEITTEAIDQLIADLNLAAANVQLDGVYQLLDSIDIILQDCEFGTSYGMYPVTQQTKLENLTIEVGLLIDASDVTGAVAYIPTLEEAITKFWTTMIIIDWTQDGNSKFFPVDTDDAVAVEEQLGIFNYSLTSPWAIANINIASGECTTVQKFTYENAMCDEGNTRCNELAWYMNSTTDYWYFTISGYAHPHSTTMAIGTMYTAPADGIYIFGTDFANTDATRLSKNRGAMDAHVVFIQQGDTAIQNGSDMTVTQEIEKASYYYAADGSNDGSFDFYANLKAGDVIAFAYADCSTSNTIGNALTQVTRLTAISTKDGIDGYSVADAEEAVAKGEASTFFNPYTIAPESDFENLESTITSATAVYEEALNNIGESVGQFPQEPCTALDSIIKLAKTMYSMKSASGPEVSAMITKINNAIATLYVNRNYTISIEEALIDTLIFTPTGGDSVRWDTIGSHAMPSGLYYIRHTESGLYVTAPSSASDKGTFSVSALIDSTFTQQNAQVFYFKFSPVYYCYGIATHYNDGGTWSSEAMEAVLDNQSTDDGFLHIAETGAARVGGAWYPVLNATDLLWRTHRVYFNGINYCINAAHNLLWDYYIVPNASNTLTSQSSSSFCWEIVPYQIPDKVINLDGNAKEVMSDLYYNLKGMYVGATAPAEKGIYIHKQVMSDGSTKVTKILK